MLANQQKKDVVEKIKNTINYETDSFYLIMSCDQCFGKVITIGQDFDVKYATDQKPSMVF